jgi:GT2 family glycosyltransferase
MTPSRPVRIAVTIACFNRRETTLRCLRSLLPQQTDSVTLDVYLVDDASPDGTGAAVREAFPQVHVLTGTGGLFWGGGMHRAMSEAIKQPFDFILWLNDDVTLRADALADLLAAQARAEIEHGPAPSIIVGAVTDPASGRVSYAGFDRRNWYHPAQVKPVLPRAGQLTACDSMNGNCVLIPAAVVDRIGIIDGQLLHRYGDIDYGYRARRAGARVLIAPEPIGTCSPNPPTTRKNLAGKSFSQRWKILTAPLGTPLGPMFRFMWRHGGVVGAALAGWTTVKVAMTAVNG